MKLFRRLRELIRKYIDESSGMTRIQITAMVLLAITVALVGIASFLRSRPREINLEKDESKYFDNGKENERLLTVHVAGAVVVPGVYQLEKGDRVQKAIEAAGGPAPDADIDGLNLARKVKDGEQIVVPSKVQQQEQRPGNQENGFNGHSQKGAVNINLAEAEELETLPGIGPVLAERIIEFREKNGPFSNAEDLSKVPGIGEKKLKDLIDLIAIG